MLSLKNSVILYLTVYIYILSGTAVPKMLKDHLLQDRRKNF